MAYGVKGIKPRSSKRGIEKGKTPGKSLTPALQKGKTGLEGAMKHSFGGMPASGNFQGNAGSSTRKERGPGTPDPNTQHIKHPGSHGGASTGSVNTLTRLIFHPKGGFDNKQPAGRKSPKGSGGYKDSGARGSNQVVGVSK